ncbi:hypothetical protein [Luteipulveratus halotolerans]|nr:hypothetical protein [Luteipulveratus halotolerans]
MTAASADAEDEQLDEIESVLSSDVAVILGRKAQALSPSRDALLTMG